MNAALLAQVLLQLLQTAQGIAQTQGAAAAAGRDVTDEELTQHRSEVSAMRDKLLADLAAGS